MLTLHAHPPSSPSILTLHPHPLSPPRHVPNPCLTCRQEHCLFLKQLSDAVTFREQLGYAFEQVCTCACACEHVHVHVRHVCACEHGRTCPCMLSMCMCVGACRVLCSPGTPSSKRPSPRGCQTSRPSSPTLTLALTPSSRRPCQGCRTSSASSASRLWSSALDQRASSSAASCAISSARTCRGCMRASCRLYAWSC